jgi:hypothetical protein
MVWHLGNLQTYWPSDFEHARRKKINPSHIATFSLTSGKK